MTSSTTIFDDFTDLDIDTPTSSNPLPKNPNSTHHTLLLSDFDPFNSSSISDRKQTNSTQTSTREKIALSKVKNYLDKQIALLVADRDDSLPEIIFDNLMLLNSQTLTELLLCACKNNVSSIISHLIECGAKRNVPSDSGYYPITWAVDHLNGDSVLELLSISYEDDNIINPLHPVTNKPLIFHLVEKAYSNLGEQASIRRIFSDLLAYGVSANSTHGHHSPSLLHIVFQKNGGLVPDLIHNNADVNAFNLSDENKTALDVAFILGHQNIYLLLSPDREDLARFNYLDMTRIKGYIEQHNLHSMLSERFTPETYLDELQKRIPSHPVLTNKTRVEREREQLAAEKTEFERQKIGQEKERLKLAEEKMEFERAHLELEKEEVDRMRRENSQARLKVEFDKINFERDRIIKEREKKEQLLAIALIKRDHLKSEVSRLDAQNREDEQKLGSTISSTVEIQRTIKLEYNPNDLKFLNDLIKPSLGKNPGEFKFDQTTRDEQVISRFRIYLGNMKENLAMALRDILNDAGIPSTAGVKGVETVLDVNCDVLSKLRREGKIKITTQSKSTTSNTSSQQQPRPRKVDDFFKNLAIEEEQNYGRTMNRKY